MTVQINASQGGTFKADFFFKRATYPPEHIAYWNYYIIQAIASSTRSAIKLTQELGTQMSGIGKSVIAVFGTTALIGTAAELGLWGIALIIPTVVGLIFFTIVGFLHPLISLMSIILGVTAYILLSRSD